MIGEQLRRVDVERRVRRELERVDLYRLPVNPVTVANRLRMKIRGVEFVDDTVISAIETRDGSAEIFVADAEAPYRKRFAIAHALGHYFLHLSGISDGEMVDHDRYMFLRGIEPALSLASEGRRLRNHQSAPGARRKRLRRGTDRQPRRKEIEANWFAVELLMPEDFVLEEWDWRPSVWRLARVFNVPEEAIEYRIDELGL